MALVSRWPIFLAQAFAKQMNGMPGTSRPAR